MVNYVAHPWILTSILALVVVYWHYHQRYPYLWLRLLTILGIIIALAGAQIPLRDSDILALLDVSDSVGTHAKTALETLQVSNTKTLHSYYFAGNIAEHSTDTLNTNTTNIARAINAAQNSNTGRILLISDGIASQGNIDVVLDEFIENSSVPIDTLYIPSKNNIHLNQLYIPESAGYEQRIEAVAILESNIATDITLYADINGEPLEPIPYSLRIGENAIPFNFLSTKQSSMQINVHIESSIAQPQQDDQQQAILNLRPNQTVLVIGDPFIYEMLQQQDIDSVFGEAKTLTGQLDEYSAIVIRASSGDFSRGQLELLERYVLEGGGLFMTGGDNTFGMGGWYRTPIEAVLPVNTDLKNDVTVPLVAMIMIIDQSNSMNSGQPAKIELAKEGAIQVIELAYEQDRLGLMTFSNDYDWVFQPRRSSRAAKEAMIEAVLDIDVNGGTVLHPAYEEAINTLTEIEAAIKHIIILSDGQLTDSPFSNVRTNTTLNTLAERARNQGITTSSIAVGQSADFTQLETIATQGGGRYYAALDATTLPRIFTSEALTATRALLREGSIEPQVHTHALLSLSQNPPPLEAYISTRLKADSDLLLEGVEGEAILAISRQGLGRSAALTTDLNQWAGDFGRWQHLPQLISSVVHWLQANPNDYISNIQMRNGTLWLSLDAVREGNYLNEENLSVRYQGTEIPLQQQGFGHYEIALPTHTSYQSGDDIVISNGGRIISRHKVPTLSGEFSQQGGRALLQNISERSGGDIIESGSTYEPQGVSKHQVLRTPFILGALVLFILELILRRFGHRFLLRQQEA